MVKDSMDLLELLRKRGVNGDRPPTSHLPQWRRSGHAPLDAIPGRRGLQLSSRRPSVAFGGFEVRDLLAQTRLSPLHKCALTVPTSTTNITLMITQKNPRVWL